MSLRSDIYYERQEFITELRTMDAIAGSSKLSATIPIPSHVTPLQKVVTGESLLLNGLSVTAFAKFDYFISFLSRSYAGHESMLGIPFDELPPEMQSVLTMRLLNSFGSKIPYEKDSAGRKLKDNDKAKAALDVAATMTLSNQGRVTAISKYSFLPDRYDLSYADFSRYLKSFGHQIEQLELLLTNLGRRSVIPNFSSVFNRVRNNRNTAAHDTNTTLAPTDLQADLESMLDFAMAFEFLLAQTVWVAKTGKPLDEASLAIDTVPFIPLQHDFKNGKHSFCHKDFKRSLATKPNVLEAYDYIFDTRKRFNGKSQKPRAILILEGDKIIDWATWVDFD